jgi:hypothetical protein
MKDIYTKAEEVIIWLGESNQLIDKAIDAIPHLNSGLDDLKEDWNWGSWTMHLQRLVTLQAHPQSGKDLWRYFQGHSSPDYGHSQKAVLPRKLKVMCGYMWPQCPDF